VLVNARAAVIGVLPGVPQEQVRLAQADAAPRGERRIWLRGWTSVPVFEFDGLAPGQVIAGPAIVESGMTTVLLRPGNNATVTPHGWLDIAVG
jgi:N-methylhydantoinase A